VQRLNLGRARIGQSSARPDSGDPAVIEDSRIGSDNRIVQVVTDIALQHGRVTRLCVYDILAPQRLRFA